MKYFKSKINRFNLTEVVYSEGEIFDRKLVPLKLSAALPEPWQASFKES